MRKYVPYIILGLAVTALIVVQVVRKRPVNWDHSYSLEDKIPFGNYILFERLGDIFPNQEVFISELSPYDLAEDTTVRGVTYVMIGDYYAPDEYESRQLLNWVDKGNSLFIAASAFGGLFADTVGAYTEEPREALGVRLVAGTNYPSSWLSTTSGDEDASYPFIDGLTANHFYRFGFSRYSSRKLDIEKEMKKILDEGDLDEILQSADTKEIGVDNSGDPVFIEIPWGNGLIYLHSCPQMFTNYNMLYKWNADYVAWVFSHLPLGTVYWDEYMKPLAIQRRNPLRYVLSNQALSWAWYVLLAGMALLLLFHARRRQRTIPVVEPLRNTSLEFTDTVGRLYLKHGDHLDLARKKVRYLLEHIRARFQLPTHKLDEDFVEKLHQKSGCDKEFLSKLFMHVSNVEKAKGMSAATLLRLNQLADTFYEKSK